MKGVVFEKQGASPTVVDNLEKPKPGSDQILVKSLYCGMNPVDAFMANWGILVLKWPLGLGVDASGVIVEVGESAQSEHGFKVGDYVCGCTRLGSQGYSACEEHFLMDAAVTIPRPKNLSAVEAAALGVASQTACLAVFEGLNVAFPQGDGGHDAEGEWVLVLGGASSVGKAAIQILRVLGFKVIASCSKRSQKMVEDLGAVTFDYKTAVDEQVDSILKVTSGQVSRCFDAVAADEPAVARKLFERLGGGGKKYFSTTNDWSEMQPLKGVEMNRIKLGPIGRPDAQALNQALARHIPFIVKLVENGELSPAECEVVGQGGLEDAIKAYQYQSEGTAGSKKVVVKIQDE